MNSVTTVFTRLVLTVLLFLLSTFIFAGGGQSTSQQSVANFNANIEYDDSFTTYFYFQIVKFSQWASPKTIATGKTEVSIVVGHTATSNQQYRKVGVQHSTTQLSQQVDDFPEGLRLLVDQGNEGYETIYPSDQYHLGRTRFHSSYPNSARCREGIPETEINNHQVPFWLLLASNFHFLYQLPERIHTVFDFYSRMSSPVTLRVKDQCSLPQGIVSANTPYTCHKIKSSSPLRDLLAWFLSPRFTWRVIAATENINGRQVKTLKAILLFFGRYRLIWIPERTEQTDIANSELLTTPLHPAPPHQNQQPDGVLATGPVGQVPCHPPTFHTPIFHIPTLPMPALSDESFSSMWGSESSINSMGIQLRGPKDRMPETYQPYGIPPL